MSTLFFTANKMADIENFVIICNGPLRGQFLISDGCADFHLSPEHNLQAMALSCKYGYEVFYPATPTELKRTYRLFPENPLSDKKTVFGLPVLYTKTRNSDSSHRYGAFDAYAMYEKAVVAAYPRLQHSPQEVRRRIVLAALHGTPRLPKLHKFLSKNAWRVYRLRYILHGFDEVILYRHAHE